MPRAVKRKDSATLVSSPAKDEPNLGGEYPSPNSSDIRHVTIAPPSTKTAGKKRKAEESVSTDETSPKRPKRNRRSTEKAKALPAHVSKSMRGDYDKYTTIREIPPPPLPPTRVSRPVSNKIRQVHKFINAGEDTVFDRDPQNRNLIFVPELALLGALQTMRRHYEVGVPEEASISEAEEAIVSRFKRAIAQTPDTDWLIIDISKPLKFELDIRQKIARHGLDGVNLLEVELELYVTTQLTRFGLLKEKEDVRFDAERFLKTFAAIWDKITAEEEKEEANEETKQAGCEVWSKEEELGRTGVCVAPMQEV